jgi:hypothetical protein
MKNKETVRQEQDKDLKRIRDECTENLFLELVRNWNTCILIKDELVLRGWNVNHLEDEVQNTEYLF